MISTVIGWCKNNTLVVINQKNQKITPRDWAGEGISGSAKVEAVPA